MYTLIKNHYFCIRLIFFQMMKSAKNIFLSIFVFCIISISQAEIPAGYYDAAQGKNQAELKTTLHNIIRNHTFLVYDISTSIWWYTYFKATDWNPDGYFWDMYSNYKRATYSGSLMNREHCMPRSWWGDSSNYPSYQANGDLVNLSPSDAVANTAKSNLPLGVVGTASFSNGVVKVGNNTFPGYSGTVFEPGNEYKGDFARTYLYMVTCYEDYSIYWHGTGTMSMLNGGTYPVFKQWAINMLLKWNAEDPVSVKEQNRNDGVYSVQNNRNPFIDHPELADFIWGTRKNEIWTIDAGPADTTTVFKVWFNKGEEKLHVDIRRPDEATYNIESLNGINIQTDKFSADGTTTAGNLQNGMYLMVVYTADHKRKVGKFIVNR